MFAIYSSQGRFLRSVHVAEGATEMGFHPVVGFVTEASLRDRLSRRRHAGAAVRGGEACRFRFLISQKDGVSTITALEGCSVESLLPNEWSIQTGGTRYRFAPVQGEAALHLGTKIPNADSQGLKRGFMGAALLVLVLMGIQTLLPKTKDTEPTVIESVKVTVVPEAKKIVTVPREDITDPRFQDKTVKRAVQENLGFLGLLGKKDLNKALGGVPTNVKDASPGAGPGGKEGSGGELLSGLGKGLKRATVGNTGVAGLGGIGTKGVGGGGGGYGDAMVGSGDGRTLSKIALSNEMELQGGLDRSVINATIAKYLNQIRACYETELQRQPGLQGTVAVHFLINGVGAVSQSRVHRTSLGHPGVENCIITRMRGWQFPKPVGGVQVDVKYPFLLRPPGA